MREIEASRVECVWPVKAELGESPLWSPAENALYFLDIEAPAIHRLAASGERSTWRMPKKVAALALRENGGFIAAFSDGVFALDLDSGRRCLLAEPEPDRPNNRLNDGRCDAAGRFWVGSMDEDEERSTGALYRLDTDHSLQKVDDGYIVANGPAFSPDGRILYESDTFQSVIYAFDVDDGGNVANRRVFARFETGDGRPDGLTVDSEGGVWAAVSGGWSMTRFTPDGRRDAVVRLPTSQVTASSFGGAKLDQLYITTARSDLSADEIASQPLAGSLFAVDVGFRGLAPHAYAG